MSRTAEVAAAGIPSASSSDKDKTHNDDIGLPEVDRSNSDPPAEESVIEENDLQAPRLSLHVFTVIEEVQRRQLAGQMEEALNELNALYTEYDELSSFEQATLLNFYTNTLLSLEMWSESISAFTLMLTIPDLRPDISSRATLSLGQLHSRVGEYNTAVAYYRAWLDNPNSEERPTEQENRVRDFLQSAEDKDSN